MPNPTIPGMVHERGRRVKSKYFFALLRKCPTTTVLVRLTQLRLFSFFIFIHLKNLNQNRIITVKITILCRDRDFSVPILSNIVLFAFLSVPKRSMTVLNHSIAFLSVLIDSNGHETVEIIILKHLIECFRAK